MMRAGVLQVASICRTAATRPASPFGSVVTGSLGLPSGLPFAIGASPSAGGLPRYEPVLGRSSRSGGASNSYPTRNFATLGTFVTRQRVTAEARSFLFRLALHV